MGSGWQTEMKYIYDLNDEAKNYGKSTEGHSNFP